MRKKKNIVCALRAWLAISVFCLISSSFVKAEIDQNAALLYYQALIPLEKMPHDRALLLSTPAVRDQNLIELRGLIEEYRECIRLVEMASVMPSCDFDFVSPEEYSRAWRPWVGIRRLSKLLKLEVYLNVMDSEYSIALKYSDMLRLFANQLNHCQHQVYLFSELQVRMCWLEALKLVLESSRNDSSILKAIQRRIADDNPKMPIFTRYLINYRDYVVKHAATRMELRNRLTHDRGVLYNAEREPYRTALTLSDDEFMSYRVGPYLQCIDQVIEIVKEDLTSVEKYNKIKNVTVLFTDPNQHQFEFYGQINTDFAGMYLKYLKYMSFYGILSNATELYLIKNEKGTLPTTLPDFLVKDPHTGQPFSYRILDDGFALGYDVRHFHPQLHIEIREVVFRGLIGGAP